MSDVFVPSATPPARPRPGWYRSLYWRIALAVIALVALMLAAEGALFLWLSDRTAGAMPGRNPQQMVRLVAQDFEAALTAEPSLDVEMYLREQYGHVLPDHSRRCCVTDASSRTTRTRQPKTFASRRSCGRSDRVSDGAVEVQAEMGRVDRRDSAPIAATAAAVRDQVPTAAETAEVRRGLVLAPMREATPGASPLTAAASTRLLPTTAIPPPAGPPPPFGEAAAIYVSGMRVGRWRW